MQTLLTISIVLAAVIYLVRIARASGTPHRSGQAPALTAGAAPKLAMGCSACATCGSCAGRS